MPGAPAPGFLDDYGGVQILEEKRDDYEPNSEEIENYAEWLALSPASCTCFHSGGFSTFHSL